MNTCILLSVWYGLVWEESSHQFSLPFPQTATAQFEKQARGFTPGWEGKGAAAAHHHFPKLGIASWEQARATMMGQEPSAGEALLELGSQPWWVPFDVCNNQIGGGSGNFKAQFPALSALKSLPSPSSYTAGNVKTVVQESRLRRVSSRR